MKRLPANAVYGLPLPTWPDALSVLDLIERTYGGVVVRVGQGSVAEPVLEAYGPLARQAPNGSAPPEYVFAVGDNYLTLDEREFESARLTTLDGIDYFWLTVTLRSGLVVEISVDPDG
jgi:hypothetical protein